MTMPNSSDIQKLVDSSVTDDVKINFLERHIGEIDISNLMINEEYKTLIQILTFDSIIATGDKGKIELLIKDIQNSSIIRNGVFNTDNYLHTYIRSRYNDLLGDYQFLVKNEGDKIFELINKKTLLFNTIPKSYENLRNIINYKLLKLLIVSRYDFRKASLVSFVHGNTNYNVIDPHVKELFTMVLDSKIIPVEKYCHFINQIKESSAITRIPQPILYNNLLENNIFNLSNYYKSIKISKIYKILNVKNDCGIEEIIFKMVLSDRLPAGTKIDQKKDMLIFGNILNDDYNHLNIHIKEVSNLVDNISTNIIAGQ